MPNEEPPNIPVARRTWSQSRSSLVPKEDATMAIPPAPSPIERREDAPPPAKRREDLFPTFDLPLATVLQELFNAPKESDSILCDALKNSTIQTWGRFSSLIRDFEDFTYLVRGEPKKLPRFVHQELHLFLTYGDHLEEQGKDPTDHSLYTRQAFRTYSRSALSSVKDSTVNRASTLTTFSGTKSPDQLRYESWTRKTWDETTFPVLNNNARFEHWLVKFKASKLDSNGIDTTTFLDPNWSPQHPFRIFDLRSFLSYALCILKCVPRSVSQHMHTKECHVALPFLSFGSLHQFV
eukprot:jgi/Psemu1/23221/gm1.23221_g